MNDPKLREYIIKQIEEGLSSPILDITFHCDYNPNRAHDFWFNDIVFMFEAESIKIYNNNKYYEYNTSKDTHIRDILGEELEEPLVIGLSLLLTHLKLLE